MKKLSLLLLGCALAVHTMSAQNEQDFIEKTSTGNDAGSQWIFGLGINLAYNPDSQFEDLFSNDNYAFGGVPLYISAETNIANKWTAKAVLSSNRWKDGKSYEGQTILGESEGGNDAGYLAFDIAANYYFLNSDMFMPYLSGGMGVSHFGDYITQENPGVLVDPTDVFTFNFGLGINVWFSDQWGLNLNTLGKWGVGSNSTNHHQSSIGVLYQL